MTNIATIQQIFQAYSSLTDDEIIAIRKAASIHMRGTRFSEPLDLVHEAVGLLADGIRHWPMHVDFSRFMYATMRSIAYAQRRRLEAKLDAGRNLEDLLNNGDLICIHAESAEDHYVESELGRIVMEAAWRAHGDLASDQHAQIAIECLVAGLAPSEACANFKMAMKPYRAARKRAITAIKRLVADRLH